MKFICFKTTTDDKDIAERICSNIISEGYSPCTTIKNIESKYIWNERIVNSREYQIDIKSIDKYSNAIADIIKKINNYETPQIISNEITIHNQEYKKWYIKCLNQ